MIKIDDCFSKNPTTAGTNEVGEWYELVPFSFAILFYHILLSIYRTPFISLL